MCGTTGTSLGLWEMCPWYHTSPTEPEGRWQDLSGPLSLSLTHTLTHTLFPLSLSHTLSLSVHLSLMTPDLHTHSFSLSNTHTHTQPLAHLDIADTFISRESVR